MDTIKNIMENTTENIMEKLTVEGVRNIKSWMRPDKLSSDQMKPGRVRNEDME